MLQNPKSTSGYSQIDHLILTPYAIFVIETKNYQGTVYGGKDRRGWLVNGKFKIMNPFLQNYGHIEAVKKLFNHRSSRDYISIVSFTKRCTFKMDEMDYRKITSNDLIVYDVELSEFIHRKISFLKLHHKIPVFSEKEIEKMFEALCLANVTDSEIRRNHIKVLKNAAKNKKEPSFATCIVCQQPVSEKVVQFCLSHPKFQGKIYCYTHQKDVK